jgi:hypothetical protein
MNDNERELAEIAAQMDRLAARSAVLSAQNSARDIQEHLDAPLDLRSFIAGLTASYAGEIDASEIASAVRTMEPEIARLEMETTAASGSAFDDLPVYDPGNGS